MRRSSFKIQISHFEAKPGKWTFSFNEPRGSANINHISTTRARPSGASSSWAMRLPRQYDLTGAPREFSVLEMLGLDNREPKAKL